MLQDEHVTSGARRRLSPAGAACWTLCTLSDVHCNVRVGLQESQVTALKPEGTRAPVGAIGCVLAGGTGDLALNPSFSGPQFPMGKMA